MAPFNYHIVVKFVKKPFED
ncbi:hypothetical protein CCACVL1_18450 [Corchorus capsularis]|uniref:Uncharacterized protein n=1 Tax=Corchorus capsularis TaxID=210143 RepID=A0A1R3HL33_COCAP|nr:hypothetical protein CCACVL1_18450 [Corchorus capsularis]